jgi:hypothetical protein
MPVGSVRSLLALGVVLAFIVGSGYVIVAGESDLVQLIVGGWLATVGIVIKDYFTMRNGS